MEITIGTLDELSVEQIVTVFKERVAVFVVEQNCPYQEIDEADYTATHIGIWQGTQLLAYCRVMYQEQHVTFGRVIVAKGHRGKQLGRKIVELALEDMTRNAPAIPVQISAQAHLTDFYGSFGFETVSAVYLEDDIPHVDMRLRPGSWSK